MKQSLESLITIEALDRLGGLSQRHDLMTYKSVLQAQFIGADWQVALFTPMEAKPFEVGFERGRLQWVKFDEELIPVEHLVSLDAKTSRELALTVCKGDWRSNDLVADWDLATAPQKMGALAEEIFKEHLHHAPGQLDRLRRLMRKLKRDPQLFFKDLRHPGFKFFYQLSEKIGLVKK